MPRPWGVWGAMPGPWGVWGARPGTKVLGLGGPSGQALGPRPPRPKKRKIQRCCRSFCFFLPGPLAKKKRSGRPASVFFHFLGVCPQGPGPRIQPASQPAASQPVSQPASQPAKPSQTKTKTNDANQDSKSLWTGGLKLYIYFSSSRGFPRPPRAQRDAQNVPGKSWSLLVGHVDP